MTVSNAVTHKNMCLGVHDNNNGFPPPLWDSRVRKLGNLSGYFYELNIFTLINDTPSIKK